jgi:NADPH:quinone reductase-like Zn-dependent oxidoreductase
MRNMRFMTLRLNSESIAISRLASHTSQEFEQNNNQNNFNHEDTLNMSPVLSLEGKTAIVTGGAGGLGLVITDLFLEAGAKVVAVDINTDLVQKFGASHDESKAFAVEANVTLEDDLNDVFKTTIKRFGQIDIIVNNAGLTDRLGKFSKTK